MNMTANISLAIAVDHLKQALDQCVNDRNMDHARTILELIADTQQLLPAPLPVAPPVPTLNDEEKGYLDRGSIIPAIKGLRERFVGLGLKEAKDLCDSYRDAFSPAKKAWLRLNDGAREFMSRNDMISAIKSFRNYSTGISLKEAKDVVELAREHRR